MLGIYVNEAQRSLTGLGDVPNDFEAGSVLCYLPVRQGWIYGHPVTGPDAGVPAWRDGLGQDPATAAAVAATTPNGQAALKTVVRTQRAQVLLQVLSTLSVMALAGVTVWGALRRKEH